MSDRNYVTEQQRIEYLARYRQLARQGATVREAAEKLGLSYGTLQQWVTLYRKGYYRAIKTPDSFVRYCRSMDLKPEWFK